MASSQIGIRTNGIYQIDRELTEWHQAYMIPPEMLETTKTTKSYLIFRSLITRKYMITVFLESMTALLWVLLVYIRFLRRTFLYAKKRARKNESSYNNQNMKITHFAVSLYFRETHFLPNTTLISFLILCQTSMNTMWIQRVYSSETSRG